MKGKTIKLFIRTDEVANNLKSAELSNWIGKCYIGDRKHLKNLKDFDELNAPAIYFLISQNINSIQKKIYIGEADNVQNRIKQHSAKEWWDQFIVFVSKDNNLTKSHVRYLEKKLYDLSLSNLTSIDLDNNTSPPGSRLPDSDISDMDDFQENIVFILSNLGIIDFTKKKENEVIETKSDTFFISLTTDRKNKNNEQLKGKMALIDSGYRLLSGSYIEAVERKSFLTHTYYPVRKKIEKNGFFTKSNYDNIYVLNKDIDFKSPSAAASVVKNRATNGQTEWKLENGTNLAEYLSQDS